MPMPPDDELRAIFESAPHVVTEQFVQNRYLAVPMETRGIVAWWQPHASSFDVWVSTQSPTTCAPSPAASPACRRAGSGSRWVTSAAGSGRRPTSHATSRSCCSPATTPAAAQVDRGPPGEPAGRDDSPCRACTVTVAADHQGTILGIAVDHLDEVGAYPMAGSAAAMGAVIFTGPYRIPRLAFESQSAFTNTCSRAPYRGPWQFETYFREQASTTSPASSARPPRSAPAQRLHRNELPVHAAARHPHLRRFAGGDTRAGGGDARLRRVPRLAAPSSSGRSPAGCGYRLVHRAAGMIGPYSTEPTPHPHPARRDRRTFTSAPDRTAKVSRPRPRSSSASSSGCRFDEHHRAPRRHQRDPLRLRNGGSRSGPILGAAIQGAAQQSDEKVTDIAAHLLEAAPYDIESPGGWSACGAHPRECAPWPRSRRHAYLHPGSLPPGMAPA